MKKLRWTTDGGGFWDLDVSTPRTLDGLARPVPGDALPLGLTRGARLSRPKQVDFFQRFMAVPLLPSYSLAHGFALQRVLTLPFSDSWFASVLAQFDLQKFVNSVNGGVNSNNSTSSLLERIWGNLRDKSLYSFGLSSDFLSTSDDRLIVNLDTYGDDKVSRKKAIFRHKFKHHDLTVEAVSPGLFVDNLGNYWDVPFSMAVDLASITSQAGSSYHLSLQHNAGSPSRSENEHKMAVPTNLLSGLSAKCGFSLKKNFDIWRSKAQKLRMIQPNDMFLSNPHISTSGTIGAVVTTLHGDNLVRSRADESSTESKGFYLHARGLNSAILTDAFATLDLSGQYGNFQRLFLDLTRFHARLDFPSGSRFLSGATRIVDDVINSQQPREEALKSIFPNVTLSLQQQIAGPVSFRVDSRVGLELQDKAFVVSVEEPVFALEYALQVLGSAKAIAWYSPKHQEFMVELRFFET